MWVEVVVGLIVLILALVVSLVYFLHWFFARLAFSIHPVAPKEVIPSTDGVDDPNPLFRHLPQLKSKVAWEQLGVFPTPIHSAQLQKADKTHHFWIKREDLSSPIYGGNKVRTLQYQFPSCRAHLEKHPSGKIYVVGSGGSNQVVATLAHGATLGLKFHVVYVSGDAPDIDNTLNFLSSLSFGPLSVGLWDHGFSQLRILIKALKSSDDKAFGPGGMSIGGVLGQMGGALELAEQISRGELPDVDEIYFTIGSGCTTAGLALGVCLARHLKLNAFKSHHFKIVTLMVHGGFAGVSRLTNVFSASFGKHYAISPRYIASHTAAFFKSISGIDLQNAVKEFFDREWELVDSASYVGQYGAHTKKSEVASAYADANLVLKGTSPEWVSTNTPPQPWLCGHFAGKAFTFMLDRMEASTEKKNILFWQTKSNIQPLGSHDEWTDFRARAAESKALKKWADEGKATSPLRQGKIDVDKGVEADYRKLMTVVSGSV